MLLALTDNNKAYGFDAVFNYSVCFLVRCTGLISLFYFKVFSLDFFTFRYLTGFFLNFIDSILLVIEFSFVCFF